MSSKLLAVTPGDSEGIGYEIIIKCLRQGRVPTGFNLLCVGARKPFTKLGAKFAEVKPSDVQTLARRKLPRGADFWLLPAPAQAPKDKLLAGFQSGWSIQTATEFAKKKWVSALVTGPIHKERMTAGGFSYPGHTEFLAKLCSRKGAPAKVTMMLANDLLRVSLVTTHLAVGKAPSKITKQAIGLAIQNTHQALHDWWGIKKPRIAVAALNPHAGEGGLFGREEKTTITPAVQELARLLKNKAEIIGPMPADTLFAKHVLAPKSRRYDAVICMYHDQGLIPVKLLDFPHTVNITLGLPIIRTSVDHGVGFDIAGKGIADPTSMISALTLAARLVRLSERKKR